MSDEKPCPTCGRCPTCGQTTEPKATYPAMPMTWPIVDPMPYYVHPVQPSPWPWSNDNIITCEIVGGLDQTRFSADYGPLRDSMFGGDGQVTDASIICGDALIA